MSLGIITEAEFELELNRFVPKLNNDTSRLVIESREIVHGRGNKQETPELVRELIASEAIAGARPSELSKEFNVSSSSVSAYKHGNTSTASYNSPSEELARSNDQVREHIAGKAQDKLVKAIEAIDLDSKLKPNIASAIARDMSSIVKNLQPDPSIQVNNNKVIIYKPRMKEEEDYEVIEVSE